MTIRAPKTWERKLPLSTITYCAPEQLQAGTIGPWTDVWGIGLILYLLVTGKLPGNRLHNWRDTFARGAQIPQPLKQTHPDAPEPWSALVEALHQLQIQLRTRLRIMNDGHLNPPSKGDASQLESRFFRPS